MSCSCAPSAHDEMCLVIEMLLEGRRLKRCHSTCWAHCELPVIDQPDYEADVGMQIEKSLFKSNNISEYDN
ncbi:hypothetical protein TNCT_154601 [Trichonephila clavata]|uniref:Uncharacterized protein n=1 Tax=Trichonephila clavata TaxID=2740835 RepID=A0A8X6FIL5_TRICU|nr:hypothetical protein TNCT_154601 [Trichonephila clavata]